MKRRLLYRFVPLLLVLTLLFPCFAKGESTKLRMGYFELENYMEGAEEGGEKNGYIYALMNELALMTGWEYEFVYGSFSELYDRLLEGEIDLLPCIVRTDKREKEVLFADVGLPDEQYYLAGMTSDEKNIHFSPDALQGASLATVENAWQNTVFEHWAVQNGVSMHLCSTPFFEDTWNMVRDGRAQYVLAIDTCNPEKGFTGLCKIGSAPVAFAVNPQRPDLKQELEQEYLHMVNNLPETLLSLRQRYIRSSLASYMLSEEERAFVSSHRVLRVAGLANDMPYCYLDEKGKVTGVYADVLERILNDLHLDITAEWTLYPSVGDMREAVSSGKADLMCPEYYSPYEAEKNILALSNVVISTPMSMLSLPEASLSGNVRIATGKTRPAVSYVKEFYPEDELLPYSDLKASIRAVTDGSADCVIAHTYALEREADQFDRSFHITQLSARCSVCFAAARKDRALILLLDRGLGLINDSDVNSMEIRHALQQGGSISVLQFLKEHIWQALALAAVVLALLILVINRSVNNEKQKKELIESSKLQEKLKNYQNAIQSGSLITLEVNLTKDELSYGIWKTDDGKPVELTDILGLHLPCSYDRYIDAWKRKFVSGKSEKTFKTSTDREHLLQYFAEGKTEMTFDYTAETISGNQKYLRRSICMIRDSAGDVISYTTVKDISEIDQAREHEAALLKAIARDYESMDVINLENGNLSRSKDQYSTISPSYASRMGPEWINEKDLKKRLEMTAQHLAEEERAAFLEETGKDPVLQSFSRDEIHVVNFRFPEGDNNTFFQERFIPIRNRNRELIGMLNSIRCTDNEIKKELGYRRDLEKARDEALQASQAKSSFLFNMSHDVRTPMNAILGYTGIALKKNRDGEIGDYLQKIDTAGKQLLSLVNQVLEMSRIESGRIVLQEQKIDLDAFVNTALTVYAGHAEEKGLTMDAELENAPFVHLLGDEDRLTQVVNNLISNAIKYTPDGGKVLLRIGEEETGDDSLTRLHIVVEDNGIGMSSDYLPHLFEEFSREESSTVSRIQGTGLGMPIVKKLVDLMGGSIDVTSSPGKGTRFTVLIPFRIDLSFQISAQEKSASGPVSLQGMRILLVEDNEMNREIATEILTDVGAVVDIAEDGVIAVEKVKASRPGDIDVILMDVQMPRMNGYEATRAIRKLENRDQAGLRILAMTANAFEEDRRNALAAGMDGHLAKPIDIPTLLETLASPDPRP